MKFSRYQELIFSFATHSSNNAVVEAVAGSGKTTTAIQAMSRLPSYNEILFAAFNKTIVDELEKKVPDGVTVKTLHSIGWSALRRTYGGNVKLNDGKSMEHVEKLFSNLKKERWYWGYIFNLIKLSDIVRQEIEITEEAVEAAMEKHGVMSITGNEPGDVVKLIESCLSDVKQFDFTDMIFIPALLPEIKLPKFDFVFIDELQDLNVAQQILVEKSLGKSSRFMGLGDSRQSIYGFRGSDQLSFQKFKQIDNTSSLPLSICYRCAKSVVAEAKQIVPQIESSPFQIDGIVREGTIEEIQNGDWVICRNTKPLVMLAFVLIAEGKPAKIKGKEIGQNLIDLMTSTQYNIQSVVVRTLKARRDKMVENYRDTYKMERPELHPRVLNFDEDIQIIEYLFDKLGGDVRSVTQFLKSVFSDDNASIILSTIHKSKGLENPRVFFLRPDLLPSRYATADWQIEQEMNLKYVAITRAQKELIYVRDFNFEKLSKIIKNG